MNLTLSMEFEEAEPLLLGRVSALLNDIELSYDLGVLLTEPEHREYRFTRFFWFRNTRRVRKEFQLRIKRISHASPLVLEVVASSLGGLWVLIQIIERVRNWPLSREKLELEVDKLRRERAAHRESVISAYQDQIDRLADDRDAQSIGLRLTQRMTDSPLKLRKLEIEIPGDEVTSKLSDKR